MVASVIVNYSCTHVQYHKGGESTFRILNRMRGLQSMPQAKVACGVLTFKATSSAMTSSWS